MNNVVEIGSKKITITRAALMDSNQALTNLVAIPLPTATEIERKNSYWVGKQLKIVTQASKHVSIGLNKKSQALLAQHGEKHMAQKQGAPAGELEWSGQYKINDDAARAAFDSAWEAAINETVEIEVAPISLSRLAGSPISGADLGALDWLLVE